MTYQKKGGFNDNKTIIDKRFSAGLSFFFVIITLLMMTSSMTTIMVYADKSSSSGGSGSSNPPSSNSPESSSSSSSSGSTASDSDKDKDVDTSNTPAGSGSTNTNNPDAGTDTGTSSSSGSGSSTSGNTGSSSQQPAHCDRPGYPSCSSLGTEAAQNAAPGSSCPSGHSKAFCNAYNAATGYSASQPGASPQQASTNGANTTGTPASTNMTGTPASTNMTVAPAVPSVPPGHTLDFGTGYTNGVNDGRVGVYDPAPACAGKTGSSLEHCYIGYNDAYVTYCHKSPYGCGDGPTTCPPGESSKDCSVPTPVPPPPPCVNVPGQVPKCPGPPPPPQPCIKGVFHRVGDHCELNKNCHYDKDRNGNLTGDITCVIIVHGHTQETHSSSNYVGGSSTLTQIPSNATDFPNNDPSAIQVHVTSAKKDTIGGYHVTGEIINKGNDTLNSVLVTVHFYNGSGNLVADTTCCYTTPTDIDPGHTATFDSFAMSNQISSKPVSFRLSYDWSVPTPTVNQAPSQSASNFTGGNMMSAAKSSSSSSSSSSSGSSPSTSFGSSSSSISGSSNSRSIGLQQIPSNRTDFPNDSPDAIQVQVVSAKKNILGEYEIKGEITNIGNDTIKFVQITAHVYDASGTLVGNDNGYTTPSDLDPHHTGTFDLFISKDILSGTPKSFRLSYDWS